jgi:hypothetical protein
LQAARQRSVDAFDVVEGLVIEGQGEIQVLTTTSLGGPLVNAWPTVSVSAAFTLHRLVEHWRTHGLPASTACGAAIPKTSHCSNPSPSIFLIAPSRPEPLAQCPRSNPP